MWWQRTSETTEAHRAKNWFNCRHQHQTASTDEINMGHFTCATSSMNWQSIWSNKYKIIMVSKNLTHIWFRQWQSSASNVGKALTKVHIVLAYLVFIFLFCQPFTLIWELIVVIVEGTSRKGTFHLVLIIALQPLEELGVVMKHQHKMWPYQNQNQDQSRHLLVLRRHCLQN